MEDCSALGKLTDASGLKQSDISILSDEFHAAVRNMPLKNLAIETLRKLLNNEIKLRQKKFLIQSRSFSAMLEQSIRNPRHGEADS